MTKEEAKNNLLQASLYRTVAFAGILWIPATKLANCSPNMNFVSASLSLIDFNAIFLLIVVFVLFKKASKLLKEAKAFLDSQSE